MSDLSHSLKELNGAEDTVSSKTILRRKNTIDDRFLSEHAFGRALVQLIFEWSQHISIEADQRAELRVRVKHLPMVSPILDVTNKVLEYQQNQASFTRRDEREEQSPVGIFHQTTGKERALFYVDRYVGWKKTKSYLQPPDGVTDEHQWVSNVIGYPG